MVPRSKARRPIILAIVAVLTLIGSAGLGLRSSRTSFTPPVEVRPGLWSSKIGGGVFVFAAQSGDKAVFFDTGMDGDAHGLAALLGAVKRTQTGVSDVFITHGHPDHTAGIAQFTNARVYAGAGDVDLVTRKASPETFLPRVFSWVWAAPAGRVSNPLTAAETITLPDQKTVRAFPVPGHTPGSFAYLFDDILIVGDIMVLEAGHLLPTPSLFNPHPDQNLASIRALATALTGLNIDRVCTSHGGCTAPGQGRALFDAFVSGL